MKRLAVVALVLAFGVAGCTAREPRARAPEARPTPSGPAATAAPSGSRLVLVGHEPLFERGMNAGLALRFPYAYVGNRTDPSGEKAHPGILVVDVGRPADPRVVGEIASGRTGTSTRELRVWPEQDLLIVLNLRCMAAAHVCAGGGRPSLSFYDVRGERARAPELLFEHATSHELHEMFLWVDPERSSRALLYVTTDTPGPDAVGLVVLDISNVRRGSVREVARWSGNRELGGSLHSLAVAGDGERAYLAHLAGGFAMLDTRAVARGDDRATLRLITPTQAAVRWSPGPHSALPVPGSTLVLTTDEVYGGSASCPWGWARLIDVADPERPRLAGELRTDQNQHSACVSARPSTRYSYSSHNPTIAGSVVLVSWHAAGLIAGSLDGGRIARTSAFVPRPLPRVGTEDPRLTQGPLKIAVWSTPIVSEGLIYVVDVRNGLYVLRYEGPGADALARLRFSEGSSNLGE